MSCGCTTKISKQMVRIIIRWAFILILASLVGAKFVHSCLEEERIGLLNLKSFLESHYHPISGDDPFETNWFDYGYEGYNCCALERVRCNPSTGRVIFLDLFAVVSSLDKNYNNTKPWLFNVTLFRPFTELIHLNLSANGIRGLIEHDGSVRISTLKNLQTLVLTGNPLWANYISFDALSSLRTLNLRFCELNHSVSALGISQLRHLQILDLSMNHIQGSVKGICQLKNLQELYLTDTYISGNVPSCLSNLTSLKVLDLALNQLNGKDPFWLPNLTHMEHLDLSHNSFAGQLSLSSLANLSMLQYLDLSSSGIEIQTEDSLWVPTFQLRYVYLDDCYLNMPHGTIPTFLTYQHNLIGVDLSNNNLTGSFPSWLLSSNSQLNLLYLTNNSLAGSLLLHNFIQSSLLFLGFSINSLEGNLPDNLGSIFPNLMNLNMSNNNFEGHIPQSIAHMEDLQMLDVSRNNFSGELPKAMFTHCFSLEMLVVSDNLLHGDIFPEYMNLTELLLLEARNNNFSGIINNSLKRSPKLKYLDVSNNNIMGHLPSSFGNLSNLLVLLTSNNSLHGQLSREICKLNLLHLDFSHNGFAGPLPQCSNFSSLITLSLNNNKFIGLIPNAFSSCSYMREIDLRDNLFSGVIPSWIYKLSSLRVLQLAGNKLHGEIPHQICQLVNIDILDLSRNQLYGRLPMCFHNMSFGMREHSTNTSFELQFQSYVTSMINIFFKLGATIVMDQATEYIRDAVEVLAKKQYHTYAGGDHLVMSALDLFCNNLSGVVPSELGDLRHISSMNLSHNNLFGSIPNSFSNLEQVESLDLSYNKLTGTIPSQLVELHSLEVFNVSFNNLSGKTPETGQFGTFDESSYLGNHELCVSLVNKSCHQTYPQPSTMIKQVEKGEETTFLMEDFFWCFGVTSSIAFLATVAVLAINPYWRRAWYDFVEYHLLWWWF